jgi:hypothetical protein
VIFIFITLCDLLNDRSLLMSILRFDARNFGFLGLCKILGIGACVDFGLLCAGLHCFNLIRSSIGHILMLGLID